MAEKKIARICWNTRGWREPSGKAGKSTSGRAYENLVGYGHEEWLLDIDKLIDGYHYAYLQPIGAHREIYEGNKYDISLYSIDGASRKRFWIGNIRDVEVTTEEQSRHVFSVYEERGWLLEMEEQLVNVGADVDDFRDVDQDYFAVVRFRPRSLNLMDEPKEFSRTDPAVKATYYKLLDQKLQPKISTSSEFTFRPGHSTKKTSTKRKHSATTSNIDLVHNRMQETIYNQLSSKYGKNNVRTEIHNVDIVVRDTDGGFIFYELKTQSFVKTCIREALGQLLIYAYYPNKHLAKELIIVSPRTAAVTTDVKSFMKMLRKKFNIPIRYQRYNPETEKLEESD